MRGWKIEVSDPAKLRPRFWERHALDELTRPEWEALCDGCAKCCLIKLEDDVTDAVSYTSIACRLLDLGTCRCGNYPRRKELVKDCTILDRKSLPEVASWLPRSCAYRRLHEGRGLADWHPLVSGDPNSVHAAGISRKGRMLSEYEVDEEDWQDFIVEEDF
jgi:uncharacterized protein